MEFTEDNSFLISAFGEERLRDRYRTIEKQIIEVLKTFNLDKQIIIHRESFRLFLDSYFTDIVRLKDFATIERTNLAKIYGYTVYWFCRLHPLNIISEDVELDFINERVISYIYVKMALEHMNIDLAKTQAYGRILETCELLLYNLKYRTYTPQSLECLFSALLNTATVSCKPFSILY